MSSPLRLPGLDQRVMLARGEAGLLARAVAALVLSLKGARPMLATSMLTALPLVPLARQLQQLHQREQAAPPKPGRPPKPRTFRVSYDQLAALLEHRAALYGPAFTATEQLLLQGVVGKFQQQSLNLSQYLTFP